ncbi:MAG: energy transducer TonB [Pirellulaceae bacterium]|nr:energy transducer TonB [Pirellulaceae bacterium]
MTSLSHATIEITVSGPIRAAAGGMRELAWTLAGNVVLHASLLAVASIIPVNTTAWMLSAVPHQPSHGDNSIQLSAAFLDAAAASEQEHSEAAPAVVIQSLPVNTEGSSELAPRKFDVSPLAALAAPRDAIAGAESLEEAAAQSQASLPDATRREIKEHPPEVADARAELAREVTSKLPAESSSTSRQANATVSSPQASGAPDVLPSETYNPFPAYPPALLARRIQATVILRLRIAADGRLAEATVHRTSGYEAMDQAALAGVRYWKFKPAIKNGKQVETVVRKPFTFVIRE